MNDAYYSLPINLGDIINKKEQPRLSLKESISAWIHLLLVTRFGEFKDDQSFGCQIWEHDFENITNSQKFKEELQKSIQQSLIRHEPRLTDIKLEVQIEQTEIVEQNRRIKIKIGIKVRATLKKTNEAFIHLESFYIGPLSYS
jgi:predicted component of type VI protein secretion system